MEGQDQEEDEMQVTYLEEMEEADPEAETEGIYYILSISNFNPIVLYYIYRDN